MVDVLLVFAVGFVAGGFAIPVGFALEVSPLAVYLAATAGALSGMTIFLFGGERLRRLLEDGSAPKPAPNPTVEALRHRGPRWLGLIGPTFPGVTASVLIGITSGMQRRALARWMTVGIAGLFGLYTLGLSLLTG